MLSFRICQRNILMEVLYNFFKGWNHLKPKNRKCSQQDWDWTVAVVC